MTIRARLRIGWLLLYALAAVGAARADRVDMADGRVLEGRFALLPGVAVDPLRRTDPAARRS
jgi:hypothetical protein